MKKEKTRTGREDTKGQVTKEPERPGEEEGETGQTRTSAGEVLSRADGSPLRRYDEAGQPTRKILTREERLSLRVLREAWNVKPEVREDCLDMAHEIVTDKSAMRRDRIRAMQGVATVDKIDLDSEKLELERERLALLGAGLGEAPQSALHIHVNGEDAEKAVIKALQLEHARKRLGPRPGGKE
jgi:hypothetical protein